MQHLIEPLIERLRSLGQVRVAVSGGVDSLTLGALAVQALGDRATLCHAVSAAVPEEATARVRDLAERIRAPLLLVDAGEFDSQTYLSNPHDRCFYCKESLYRTLSRNFEGALLSGANVDDLSDYRPGLEAARQYGVIHPFVECGVDKAAIRRICAHLGFDGWSQLPAAPCLSSRIETGLRIDPDQLRFVHRVERELRGALRPQVVRCRVRAEEIAVEMDHSTLEALTADDRRRWSGAILGFAAGCRLPERVSFEPYRMGSAFVRPA